jgi:hypothetical protein
MLEERVLARIANQDLGLWVVPLIEHGFGLVLFSPKPEPNEPFIGLSPTPTSPKLEALPLVRMDRPCLQMARRPSSPSEEAN